jgi:hypothetical protein
LLVGSMIRANTNPRNTPSPPQAVSNPNTSKTCQKRVPQVPIRDDVIASGPPPAPLPTCNAAAAAGQGRR